ncbi:MAG TPA: hypothetical protein PLY19_06400 [Rhodoglobus sp.]|nr:hypothetical protein [Rhodoglobus sp.]
MTLEAWTDFNVAVAGATAALAGLLIVALSVNVGEIVKAPTLTARAASAISTLLLGLVATASGLIPSQPLWVLGLEIALATIVAWVLQVHAMVALGRDGRTTSEHLAKSLVGIVPLAGFSVGSVMLLLGMPGGFYAVAAGCVLAIVAAVIFSWVALVEVLR